MASRFAGTTPGQLATAFDRTYGALGDALGLGPARRLQAAWQDMIAAGIAQQEARTHYALLVQGAIAQGVQRLTSRLAEKADKGERVDSVLALLRLWAVATEEVVHETLQSESGLAATTALTRSALAYRKRVQNVASIVADALDMATRRELDEAYREIQALKRELRALRTPVPAREPGPRRASKRKSGRSAGEKTR
jgi:class III poly(R)-hydroxyalkanoic acid synthase PhaE subunit